MSRADHQRQGSPYAAGYRLEHDNGRHGRPWVLSALCGEQRMWIADFETFVQATAWMRAHSTTYGLAMGLPIGVAK